MLTFHPFSPFSLLVSIIKELMQYRIPKLSNSSPHAQKTTQSRFGITINQTAQIGRGCSINISKKSPSVWPCILSDCLSQWPSQMDSRYLQYWMKGSSPWRKFPSIRANCWSTAMEAICYWPMRSPMLWSMMLYTMKQFTYLMGTLLRLRTLRYH